MTRRNFVKLTSSMGIISMIPTSVLSKDTHTRTFDIQYRFDIQNKEQEEVLRLWNPLPYNASYQKVKYLDFFGNYDKFNLNSQNKYDAKTLYMQWDKKTKKAFVQIDMKVQTQTRVVPLQDIQIASKKNIPIPNDIQIYLKATGHIPTTGIIKALATRIIKGKTDRFEKVKAIYYWCTSHTFRDKNVVGCGAGDVGAMVKEEEVEDIYKHGYYGGKCTDLSSLFTALLRASGTPAREVFGIRLGKSVFSKALGKSKNNIANISSWQHCRVEYYIPGIGWIPSDPADITKLMLVENLKYDDKKVQELNNKYLHTWEMNWIGFNYARDFILSPKPIQYPLNMFAYPYAEIDDEVLNYYDTKSFSYKIISTEIK